MHPSIVSVSLIIPSYQGKDRIVSCLNSVRDQIKLPDEVIIVIDGSTDGTESLIKRIDFPVKLKIASQKNKGRASARNAGVELASHELIVFLDDDMRIAPDTIQQHVEHHTNINGSILVGGTSGQLSRAQTDFQKYKFILDKRWSQNVPLYPQPLTQKNLFVAAANMSILKNTYNALNGFDESLSDAEDFELGLRALKSGIQIYVNLNILGWHDDFVTCEKYIQRRREYQLAFAKLESKYPELSSKMKPNAYYLKKIFYSFFAHALWVKWVDDRKLEFLPNSVRYRIYSWVVWTNSMYYPNVRL